jgi:integrase
VNTTTNGMTVEIRKEWHRTKKGCDSMTLHLEGIAVRVTQRKPNGPYCRIMFLPATSSDETTSEESQSWGSLFTADRAVAQKRGEAFLRAFVTEMSGDKETPPILPPTNAVVASTHDAPAAEATGSLALENLVTRFMEAPRFLKLDLKTQYDLGKRSAILLAGLGQHITVKEIEEDVLDLYVVTRRAGGIEYTTCLHGRTGRLLSPRQRTSRPSRDRTIEADLKFLRMMILWALKKKVADGQRLLSEDPMAGYVILEEASPRRPIATDERFLKTLAAIERLATEVEDSKLKLQYQMLGLALKALDGTGRRISAVLGLRWSDITVLDEKGISQPQIRFVRALDKAGRGAWLPLAQHFYDALMEWKRHCPRSAGDFVFPDFTESKAVRSDWMGELLGRAESLAGLAPLNGSLFHAYRRRFATAREHIPFARVMELMGITDAKVFRECYCRTSSDLLRDALADPQPVTDPRLELAA